MSGRGRGSAVRAAPPGAPRAGPPRRGCSAPSAASPGCAVPCWARLQPEPAGSPCRASRPGAERPVPVPGVPCRGPCTRTGALSSAAVPACSRRGPAGGAARPADGPRPLPAGPGASASAAAGAGGVRAAGGKRSPVAGCGYRLPPQPRENPRPRRARATLRRGDTDAAPAAREPRAPAHSGRCWRGDGGAAGRASWPLRPRDGGCRGSRPRASALPHRPSVPQASALALCPGKCPPAAARCPGAPGTRHCRPSRATAREQVPRQRSDDPGLSPPALWAEATAAASALGGPSAPLAASLLLGSPIAQLPSPSSGSSPKPAPASFPHPFHHLLQRLKGLWGLPGAGFGPGVSAMGPGATRGWGSSTQGG